MPHAEHYRELSPDLPGAHLPWLNRLRAEAQARFSATGFPSPREEAWKYTNVAPLEKKRFRPVAAGESGPVDPALLERFRLPEAYPLVFVDGRFAADLSGTAGLPEGVVALSLAEALDIYPERLEALFHAIAARESHGFVAFTTAYFRDGAFIQVPAGTVLDRPLQILHVATHTEGLAVLRHVIALETHAEAEVIETYVGSGAAGALTAAVTEIRLGENAGLTHYKLQCEANPAYHFGGIYVEQARAARFRQHQTAFGGLLARTEIRADLDEGAECTLDGLLLGTGRRHLDAQTLIHHDAPHGTSRVTYRGIAADRARGVFAGRIVVRPDAQKTDAEMHSRNLLLSEDAEIDAKPQLEIHADDVKCAHGVAIGQLDPNAVFYLESRGVDEVSARNMLTFAFANELLEAIGPKHLKNLVRGELLSFLPQADIRRDWL
jgi:Fe-S cluster assembly protein SufD